MTRNVQVFLVGHAIKAGAYSVLEKLWILIGFWFLRLGWWRSVQVLVAHAIKDRGYSVPK